MKNSGSKLGKNCWLVWSVIGRLERAGVGVPWVVPPLATYLTTLGGTLAHRPAEQPRNRIRAEALDGPPPLSLDGLHLPYRGLDGPEADAGVVAQDGDAEAGRPGHGGEWAAVFGWGQLRFVRVDGEGVGGFMIPVEGEGWSGGDGRVVPQGERIGADFEVGELDGLGGLFRFC